MNKHHLSSMQQKILAEFPPEIRNKFILLPHEEQQKQLDELLQKTLNNLSPAEEMIFQISDSTIAHLETESDQTTAALFINDLTKTAVKIKESSLPGPKWDHVSELLDALITLLKTGTPSLIHSDIQPIFNQLSLKYQAAQNPQLKGDLHQLFTQLPPEQLQELTQLSGEEWHKKVEELLSHSIDQLRLDERFILQISDTAAAILEKDPEAPTTVAFITQMRQELRNIEMDESPDSIWQDVSLYINALITLLETGTPPPVPSQYQPMLTQLLRFQ